MSLDVHYQRCTTLAREHYENFPVGRLVSAELRPHVHAVYAFARVADDLADEGYDLRNPDGSAVLAPEQRLRSLDEYEAELTRALRGEPVSPDQAWIFEPLASSARKLKLPGQLFHDLLSAFKQDVVKKRYANFEEVLDYCRRSANPVGRLVLHLHNLRDEELHLLSDKICTALQLANFWQDVSVDLVKDRVYLPEDDQARFGVTEQGLFAHDAGENFRNLIKFQVDRTQDIFDAGRTLPSFLPWKLSWEIRLTWLGGATILKKIRRQNYDTLHRRPKLSKWDLIPLLPYAWFTR